MVGKRVLGVGAAILTMALSTGCAEEPADAQERLAALEAEGRQMDAALDTVEERLLGNQAQVHLWQELGRRHQQVSAIHCQHADMHLAALLKHQEKQEEKARQLKRRRHVAAVDSTVLTSGKAAESHN
ncbi:hypothetical protein [Hyalangium rubrum]|uniref:Lipoprotein n=1 Tax=Hyalangium rubrum TaxID=3103134 RepID=A0ABU5GYB1_9BACT|nr:hypothetical protein [Hyalangium sp. s54d21]MDY7226173.1 hypothetical protein [Hyalangium sp. s54d21]